MAAILVAAVADALGVADVVVAAALWLGAINLAVAVFNLLPGAPLDGGRIVRAVLWKGRGDRQSAAVTAARSGRVIGWLLVAGGAVELVVTGAAGGVWLMLVGAFIASAAQQEELQTVVAYELHDVRVRDVMTADPVCAPVSVSVEALLHDYVMRYRCSTFPLVDEDGFVVALATLARMKAVPVGARRSTRAVATAWPLELVTVAAPDDPLLEVLRRDTGTAGGRVLVFDGDHLAGIVSPTDVARTLQFTHAADASARTAA
jgi:CBS domain-containing protein